MITINEKTIAIWYLAKKNDFNFLAAMYRNETDQLMFKGRFVHASDPNTAHWFTVGPPNHGQEQEFEDEMVDAIRLMEAELGWQADEIRMDNGDVEAFYDELVARPYIGVWGADTNNN